MSNVIQELKPGTVVAIKLDAIFQNSDQRDAFNACGRVGVIRERMNNTSADVYIYTVDPIDGGMQRAWIDHHELTVVPGVPFNPIAALAVKRQLNQAVAALKPLVALYGRYGEYCDDHLTNNDDPFGMAAWMDRFHNEEVNLSDALDVADSMLMSIKAIGQGA